MSISRDLGPSAVPPEADLRFYHTSWAVLLGAAHYSDRKIASLEGVTADLQEVEQVLIGHGFAESNIFKRYDSEVTRAEVLRLLQEELPGQVGPEDRVIFYFGGHGEVVGDEGYLVPYDGVKSAISRSCLSMKELYALGRSLEARHVLFVADACYSGHLVPLSQREPTKAQGPLEAIQPRLAEWSIEIIASSMRKQKAFERDVRGVFTGQFVRALRGEAFTRDFLFALDLASWIGGQVIDSTRSRKNLQLVEYAKEGEGSFVFLRPETRSRHRSEAILTELVSRGRFEVS